MKINDTLKTLRQSKKITQSEAAEQLGISLSSYQKYEREKNSVVPSLDVLLKLADFYHVTTDYLLGREPAAPQTPLDEFAQRENLEALEKKLVEKYLLLSGQNRAAVMAFLRACVEESAETAQPSKLPGRVYYTAAEIEAERNAQKQEEAG